jgi:hypothetical protein
VSTSVHGIFLTDIQTIQPTLSTEIQQPSAPIVIDDETMNILTEEMENLIIEGKLGQQGGDVARERAEVIQSFQAELKRPWRRRTSSSSRNRLDAPLSSSAPFRGSTSLSAEVIDVDAEPNLIESNKENWHRINDASDFACNTSKQEGHLAGVQPLANSRARSKSY